MADLKEACGAAGSHDVDANGTQDKQNNVATKSQRTSEAISRPSTPSCTSRGSTKRSASWCTGKPKRCVRRRHLPTLTPMLLKRTSSVARDVTVFLNKEMLQRNMLNHSFYQYAKRWWEEYRSEAAIYDDSGKRGHDRDEYRKMTTHLRPRLVKLFAEDDDGRFRMVCEFVTPLRAPAAIRSPSEAARFVGLLPYESNPVVDGTRDDTWRSISAVLSVGKGDAQDHALLLVSLLLGCGLDAYVCIGTITTDVQKSHLRNAKERRSPSFDAAAEIGHVAVLFWESVTGERYKVLEKGGSQHHGYCAIDCVFNHRQFYANLQPREWRLRGTPFNFEEESLWKPMNEVMIADLPYGQPPVALLPPDLLQLPTREHDWTIALKKQISSRRRANGYITRWSDELSFYLLPALNAYELERLYGVTQVENELFQQSITRFVQEGHTFQGVPVMFTFESAPEAMETLESHELVANLIHLHARVSQFGLAVRCFAYPENLVVTWVMLAVSYQSSSA
ncbi:hypothetical protein FI667_g4705, partial [Globisporangium splendens]